jgi:hypothetical protein
MTAADTIAKIRARRITASSITQSELVELVADAAALRATRLRAALRLSVLEAERDKVAAHADDMEALAQRWRSERDASRVIGGGGPRVATPTSERCACAVCERGAE